MNVILLDPGITIHASENGTLSSITRFTLILSTLGIFLSACALLLLILTACLFAEWRKNFKNQLLIQLMLIRFYYTFVRYFSDIKNIYEFCIMPYCVIYLDELSMIYSETALIAWMFVFTRHMYSSLVTVFISKASLWKLSLTTWIVPIIVSVISFAVYQSQDGNDVLFFFIYLASVKWPVLITNAILLILILKSIIKENKSKVDNNRSKTRLVIVMNILIWSFCLQQVFNDIYKLIYMSFNVTPALMVIFNISTMYHCAFSISFWVLGNADTRKLWRIRCCCTKNQPVVLSYIS